jgi:hypothetical protein
MRNHPGQLMLAGLIVSAMIATVAPAQKPQIVVTPLPATSTAPASTQPATTQPNDAAIWGEFVGVTGTVQFRPNAETPWQAAKLGDRVTAPAEIRTHARNSVALLRLGNSAVVQIPSSTRVALAELAAHTDTDTEKVYIFLNRGTVRADIYEQSTRSDFKIGCPKAVLSREGTKGIEFSYDPSSGEYRVALNTDGMIRLIDRSTGRQTEVLPGQYVTQDFAQWVQTARLDRLITLIDPNGITHIEQLLSAANAGGLASIDPTNFNTWQSVLMGDQTLQSSNTLQGLSQANQQQLQLWRDVFNPKPAQRRPYQYGNFGTHISDNNAVISPTLKKRSQFSRHSSYRSRRGI